MRVKSTWMRWPTIIVVSTTSGMASSVTPASPAWMRSMKRIAPVPPNRVLAAYMIAGPQTMRTACRSLVARHEVAGGMLLEEGRRLALEAGEVVVAEIELDVAAHPHQDH